MFKLNQKSGKRIKISLLDPTKCQTQDAKKRASQAEIIAQQERVLRLVSQGKQSVTELAQVTKLDRRTLNRRLQMLTEAGKLERVGSGNQTRYQLPGAGCK